MSPDLNRLLAAAAERQGVLNAAEEARNRAADERDAAILAAQEAGATYSAIETVTGLSTSRVTQVLRRARAARA